MTRISNTFLNLKKQNKSAFISFVTAGDPNYKTSLEIIKSLPKSGVDIIELGIPFLDPAGDGPIIEEASKRAIKNGMNLKKVLQLVIDFRKENQKTPIVLMGYYNPILHYGLEKFCIDGKNAGIDGLLIVDLPPEEDEDLRKYSKENDIDFIKLIALTSDKNRIEMISQNASGFLYLISILGITGTKSANLKELEIQLNKIKEISDLPVAVGFGIKTKSQIDEITNIGADGFVVGSALVKLITENLESKNLVNLLEDKIKNLLNYSAK